MANRGVWKSMDGFTAEELKLSAERLEVLAAFLAKLPKKKFNYCVWAEKVAPETCSIGGGKRRANTQCGTTGCALGWAAQIPEFNKLGLKLDGNIVTARVDPGDEVQFAPVDTKTGDTGADAGKRIFFLSDTDAVFLFTPEDCHNYGGQYPWVPDWSSPGGNAAPKEVAKHIRRFIKCSRSDKAIAQMQDTQNYYPDNN